jgi:hypothetical protein
MTSQRSFIGKNNQIHANIRSFQNRGHFDRVSFFGFAKSSLVWIYWDTKVTEKIAAFSLQFFGSSHARSIVNALAWRECSRPRAQAESFFTFYLGVVFSVTFRFKGA